MKSEEKTGTAIEELGLSVRAYNAVKRFGISTVEELEARIDEFAEHSHNHAEEARELLVKRSQPVIVESADYTKAVTLTRRIKANAQSAQESLWEVCRGLKEMHDSKLYKELGYSKFEEYAKNEVGFQKVQAYKYVAIANAQIVQSTEHFEAIGTEKLSILAKLDEPLREEIQQNVNVESVTVKELKKRIAEIQNSNAILQGNITNELEKSAKLQAQLESKHCEWLQACDEKTSYAQQLFHAEENLNEAKDTIQNLEKQIDELEARPIEVVAKPDEELIKAHIREIDSLQRQHGEELDELREKYQKKMREGIEKAKKEAQAPDINELWAVLNCNLDNAIEAIEDFFDDYEDHPKIKGYAGRLKTTVRNLNTLINDVLAK